MYKKITAVLLIFMITACLPINVFAYDMPKSIRIGLTYRYKEVDAVPVYNKSILVGTQIAGSFNSYGILNAVGSFSVVPVNTYFVRLESQYPTYESALAATVSMSIANIPSVVCLKGSDGWYVYFGPYKSITEATTAKASLSYSTTVVSASDRRTAIMDNGMIVVLFDSDTQNLQIKSNAAAPSNDLANPQTVNLGDRRFRGAIEFGRYIGSKLTAVNVLPINEYLYGVVPSEMPSAWNMEALKAQAVAIRSYSLYKIGYYSTHSSTGYDLCDTVHCQAYLGAGNEAESTTKAVNDTGNIIATYNNQPIEAVYSSSSGGATENSENVWSTMTPYLVSVPEINELGAKKWIRSITLTDLSKILAEKNANIGNAVSMYVANKTSAGRVAELVIVGTSGQKSLFKEEIKSYFSGLPGGSLESRMFDIHTGSIGSVETTVNIISKDGTTEALLKSTTAIDNHNLPKTLSGALGNIFVRSKSGAEPFTNIKDIYVASGQPDIILVGVGWGHGVGMSQHGANGMAELGYTYEQILKYYYTGIILQ